MTRQRGRLLLGALLAASGGVLFSLRAASVRQVQQTLGIAVMAAARAAGMLSRTTA